MGQLVRNRAGRIEFVFDPVLVEALELGLGQVWAALAEDHSSIDCAFGSWLLLLGDALL